MKSGIYKLTFKSGAEYIGKSVDIENRWKQHSDKLQKGTAALNMQKEYNTYGFPNAEVVSNCHPDHLDLVEACFITRNSPTLNTSRPLDPFSGIDNENLQEVFNWCRKSTLDHLNIIADQARLIDKFETKIIKLESETINLKKIRSDREINKEHNKEMYSKEEELKEYEDIVNNQNTKLKKLIDYKNSNWWHKLFN